MKSSSFLLSLLLALVFVTSSSAQVPSTLNYQGRVAVSGTNFTGTGQFKFALVNGAGNQTFWSNDGTSSAGSQPTAVVSLPVAGGLYSVQLGDTTLANMTVVPATAFAGADVRLRVWFSDGVNGFQLMTPDQKIAAVGYAMVAATVPDGSITAAKLAPGVGGGSIPDGSITAAKLAPGAAAANLAAGGLSAVASGGVIGSTDPNNAALIAQGFVRDAPAGEFGETWTPMPDGDAVAAHTTVWTGTELIIWGGVIPFTSDNGPAQFYTAINRGLRYNPSTGVWTPLSTVGAPQARFGHSAIWTGTEMIIWGGQTVESNGAGQTLATGGRYNPATNTWSSMMANVDNTGAPPGMPGIADARQGHLAFWTGSEMLVWGGNASAVPTLGMLPGMPTGLPGRRYNPSTNTWSSMAATLPSMGMASSYSGVWTGSEMIIWGNQAPGTSDPPAAGRYSPSANAWAALPRIPGDPVTPYTGAMVVWTGSVMVVWGGIDPGSMNYLNTGYRFNPSTSTWSAMSTTGAPAARGHGYASRNGTEIVVWGGKGTTGGAPPANSVSYSDGGRYNASSDTWQSISATDAPAFRNYGSAMAGAGKLIVWAGMQTSDMMGMGYKFMKHGGVYDFASSTWSLLNNGSPAPRFGHTSVWTGTEMIVWGGTTSTMAPMGMDSTFNDGARFNPSTGVWTPLPAANAPSGRYGHSAVWTGTEMIVWGGQRYDAGTPMVVTLNTGARFNPLTNEWTALPTLFGPTARSGHIALWTGSPLGQMIIWGGVSDGMSMTTDTGARYDVASNSWLNLSTTNAPMVSRGDKGVWTGSEMLVLGARYSPTSNSWSSMAAAPPTFAVGGGATLCAVWTGGEALFLMADEWGEDHGFASYSPVADYWQMLPTSGIPGDVDGLTKTQVLWTGSEMIVMGETGMMPDTYPTGARYLPAAGAWTDLERFGAPDQLMGAAVWTGAEMLMWGGTGSTDGFPTGNIPSDKGTRYRMPQTFYLYRKP